MKQGLILKLWLAWTCYVDQADCMPTEMTCLWFPSDEIIVCHHGRLRNELFMVWSCHKIKKGKRIILKIFFFTILCLEKLKNTYIKNLSIHDTLHLTEHIYQQQLSIHDTLYLKESRKEHCARSHVISSLSMSQIYGSYSLLLQWTKTNWYNHLIKAGW